MSIQTSMAAGLIGMSTLFAVPNKASAVDLDTYSIRSLEPHSNARAGGYNDSSLPVALGIAAPVTAAGILIANKLADKS